MANTQQTDRDIEDAKASLVARIEELGRRFQDARHKLDLSAHIAKHPVIATVAAFALGAFAGMRGGRSEPASDGRRGLGSTAITVLGAIGMRLAKEIAAHYLTDAAKTWIGDDEAAASHDPSVESFLEH